MAFSLRLALALDHGEDGSADALSAAALSVPLSRSGTAKTRVEEGKMGKNVLKICFLLSTFVVKAKIQKKPKIKDKYLWVAVVRG